MVTDRRNVDASAVESRAWMVVTVPLVHVNGIFGWSDRLGPLLPAIHDIGLHVRRWRIEMCRWHSRNAGNAATLNEYYEIGDG